MMTPLQQIRLWFRGISVFPAAMFAIGWVLAVPLGWQSAVVFVLCLLSAALILVPAQARDSFRVLEELHRHVSSLGGYDFRPIPLSEYQTIYAAATNNEETWAVKRGMDVFSDAVSGQDLRSHAKLWVAVRREDGTGDFLASQVTHATPLASWITLTTHPAKMSGLQHFQVLHELGHSNFLVSSWFHSSSIPQVALLSVPVFLVMSDWSALFAALLLLYALAALLFSLGATVCRRAIWLADELFADFFAMLRSPVSWFGRFDARALAERLAAETRIQPPSRLLDHVARLFRFLSPEEQTRYRQKVFEDNVHRLRRGASPEMHHGLPSVNASVAATNLAGYVFAASAFSLGYLTPAVSGVRVSLLALITLVFALVAVTAHHMLRLHSAVLEHQVTGSPLSDEDSEAVQVALSGLRAKSAVEQRRTRRRADVAPKA